MIFYLPQRYSRGLKQSALIREKETGAATFPKECQVSALVAGSSAQILLHLRGTQEFRPITADILFIGLLLLFSAALIPTEIITSYLNSGHKQI